MLSATLLLVAVTLLQTQAGEWDYNTWQDYIQCRRGEGGGNRVEASNITTNFIYNVTGRPLFPGSVNDSEVLDDSEVTLLPKCCPLGETLARGHKMKCEKTDLSFDPVFYTYNGQPAPEVVNLLVGDRCQNDRYRLEPHKYSKDEFLLLPNGSLFLPQQDGEMNSPYEYCLETFLEDGIPMVLPMICFPPQPPPDKWKEAAMFIYPLGCLLSVPFLIWTVLVYLLIDELRNLQGQVLSCYASCLAIAYLCLAAVQVWGADMEYNLCKVIAFMIEFFFIACFFWLNVVCFHTWRKTKNDVLKEKKILNEQRWFIYYSLYGWGFPLFILAATLFMDLMPTIPPSYIKPNFGIDACWFQSDNATLYYFYGPISFLLIINVAFFLLTIKYLHSDFSKNQKITNFRDVTKQVMIKRKRQIYIQSLLLFGAMGLNWILEVLSWQYSSSAKFWLVIDSFNTLQGIVVFFVFVYWDKKVRNLMVRWIQRKFTSEDSSRPLNDP